MRLWLRLLLPLVPDSPLGSAGSSAGPRRGKDRTGREEQGERVLSDRLSSIKTFKWLKKMEEDSSEIDNHSSICLAHLSHNKVRQCEG